MTEHGQPVHLVHFKLRLTIYCCYGKLPTDFLICINKYPGGIFLIFRDIEH